jgi:hypothetical protein
LRPGHKVAERLSIIRSGWGAHWNFQAGYRAMRLLRYQRGDVEIGMRARGFDFILGVEF